MVRAKLGGSRPLLADSRQPRKYSHSNENLSARNENEPQFMHSSPSVQTDKVSPKYSFSL